jgi:hypothetical protein
MTDLKVVAATLMKHHGHLEIGNDGRSLTKAHFEITLSDGHVFPVIVCRTRTFLGSKRTYGFDNTLARYRDDIDRVKNIVRLRIASQY